MAYEIPQELQYEEQIMFGLTTKQLLISLPFIPFAIIPFKLDLHIFGQVVLALIPVSLAGVCMFTQLPKQFWNWWTWRANRYFFLDSLKMRDLLEVKKIEKTVVKLKENNISIIKVEPINFGIKNKKEKEAIILAFQKFLNSLDFPIQIVMGTNPLNLDDYLSKLEERSKKVDQKYASLFRSYQTYLTKLVKRDGLFDRVFYLVIPEKGDVGLKVQIGVCKELLKRIGVKYKLLSGEALTDCLSSFFQDLFTDSDRESKEDVLNTIAPNELINYPKDLRSGDIFMRTIAVRGYPRSVEPGFLDRIISLSGDFDLSIHIEPYPIDSMMVSLNKELQKQRADLWAGEQKAMVNPSLEIKYKDTRSVLENLQKGDEKLFNVSLYITCKGNSEENLNLLCKRMESELNAIMMIPKIPKYEMHKGLKSVIPIGKDVLSVKRNITTKPLSAFFPFTSQFLDVEDSGIWLGLNKNHIPIIKDIFKLHNANGVVLASSGGGKSYFTKLMISRHLLNGAKVIVVDPQGEYVDLAKRFDGQVVNISRDSNTLINPMDLMGHDLGEKKLTLLDLIPIMLGEITEMQRAVLDKAIGATYQAAGITDHKKTWTKAPPLLGDVLKQLRRVSKDSYNEREAARSLSSRLEMYVDGVFKFLNKQTNIKFNNRFVCFNIGDMPDQIKPVIMFLILDYVYMKMKKDRERKILVIDEAWSLLQRTEDESYIFKIVKTCRKFNLGLLLITQDVGDLLNNQAGKALLNNSEYTVLLRQKASIIDLLKRTFKLSDKERTRLLTATAGEGLLMLSNDHSELKVVASPEEHKIITTNPDELLKRDLAKANDVVEEFEKADIDYTKGIFKSSTLKEKEVKELTDSGYVKKKLVGLYGGKREEYLLSPRFNETPEHFFVTKLIEEEIKNYTNQVWIYETNRPDIVFEANGKTYAIEVETGNKYKKDLEYLKRKIKELNRTYRDNWFFVVIDWKFKEKYARFATTYVRRDVPSIIADLFSDAIGKTTIEEAQSTAKHRKESQPLA